MGNDSFSFQLEEAAYNLHTYFLTSHLRWLEEAYPGRVLST